jgi:non-canonical purine NTP pyrophosphatase (RdgB/HAM1 family)
MVIVLATKNQHKIQEIKEILALDIQFKTLSDYVNINVKETGRTLLDNSLVKAAFTFKISGSPALADDSGLFVEALDGEPGLFSSRYGRDDTERITRLLRRLQNKKDRQATFKAIFVYYYEPNKYEVFEGNCVGEIAYETRGNKGFGYDPIFIPRTYKKTFAELGPKIKNRISHRAKALAKFKIYFKELVK